MNIRKSFIDTYYVSSKRYTVSAVSKANAFLKAVGQFKFENPNEEFEIPEGLLVTNQAA